MQDNFYVIQHTFFIKHKQTNLNKRDNCFSVVIIMRGILMLIAYVVFAYFIINAIIDIETFGDFLFFVFIGSVGFGILQFVVVALIVAITPDDDKY